MLSKKLYHLESQSSMHQTIQKVFIFLRKVNYYHNKSFCAFLSEKRKKVYLITLIKDNIIELISDNKGDLQIDNCFPEHHQAFISPYLPVPVTLSSCGTNQQ